ncbi:elongation factor g [Diplodia corticola]|uniref:Ribosome-releasing factor 2, mitochondrial n=1 Tax=Diplodia corticola TaxID=236234 RepID=A0A1J9R632_9PEZI|nr:elongation factor g [Diplodia corticola]OJD36064.1 elongation factor g [Diplodia corticola]
MATGMILGRAWRAGLRGRNVACARALHVSASHRAAQPGTTALENALQRTRNIGIIAHIDAGKTTTTERMLYYSGFTRRLGDVDEGSTVTDFLPAERARGITIQSAAISFHWPPLGATSAAGAAKVTQPRSTLSHNINLIDTPGHADFTFEVLRSLRILDGAVCILDGVAGVEAQTEQVWKQANQYQIPRIIFVNKLDRDGAAFERTIKEIGVRLHAWPAVCQIPWWKDGTGKLIGVGDAVNLRGMLWEEGGDGKSIKLHSLDELALVNPALAAELKKARVALVELLSEHDDEMVEKFLEHDEDHLAIPSLEVTESLRRCILQHPQRVVPTFAGASFRNIGVQPLLDAVVDLLPSPEERPDAEVKLGSVHGGLKDLLSGKLAVSAAPESNKKTAAKAKTQNTALLSKFQACALAFKVVNDNKRGVLVYVRVYSGTLTRNTVLFNTNLGLNEKVPRLLKMYANDAVEVDEIPAGQIGVIPGLKHARTGDTLIVYSGANPKHGPPAPFNTLQLRPIAVPPPVFFTSVEPYSLSEERHLSETLAVLLREDPSLSVTVDLESGQTQLAGMGELHLEIACDRLLNDFKAKASTGSIEISYREAVTTASGPSTEFFSREVSGKAARAGCTASVSPLDASEVDNVDGEEDPHTTTLPLDSHNRLTVHHPTIDTTGRPTSPDAPGLPETLPFPVVLAALTTGASAALARGPTHRFPLHSTAVAITFDPATHILPDTTPAALSGAARAAVAAALRAAAAAALATDGNALMEPVMRVAIAVPDHDLGAVVHDISSARGGQVLSLDEEDDGADDSSSSSSSSSTTSSSSDQHDLPLIDPRHVYAPPDPFGSSGGSGVVVGGSHERQRQIAARVPLKEMVGYLKHLRSLTKGRGTFVMSVDRFERVSGPRLKAVLTALRGGGY